MRRPSAGRGRLPLAAVGSQGWLVLAALLGVLALGLPWADRGTLGASTGADHAARVLLVAVVALVRSAYRRRDASRAVVDPAAGLAVALAVPTPVLAGVGVQSGHVAWVLASLALVVALRRDGMLGLPDRVRSRVPAT